MVGINSGLSDSSNVYGNNGASISIKHITGRHNASATAQDQVAQSTSTYQEDRVNPADNPQLETANENANNSPLEPTPNLLRLNSRRTSCRILKIYPINNFHCFNKEIPRSKQTNKL